MNTWPVKWGCISDLRKCIGKTIAAVEGVKMPWGCTWDHAWAIRFTDGTRAFFAGSVGSGIVSPNTEEIGKCSIFTPEEYGEAAAHDKRQAEYRQREERERKQRELERLKKELEG